MNRLLQFLRGYTVLEICGASPGEALNRLTEARIAFWHVEWQDSLTVRIKTPQKHADQALQIVSKALCDGKCIKQTGAKQTVGGVLKRPLLLGMLVLNLLCAVVLPNFVFFYDVEGNETISDDQILRAVSDLGIGFGTYGPNIRPHWIKNQLLYQMKELQWATVVQNGCRATIVVRERLQVPETESKKGFSNVVATQSGIITEQSVLAGQAQFQVGDTVQKGDVLVSGIVDLERIYVLENAKAEIFARTWRDKQVVIPGQYQGKARFSDEKHCIWLVIGRERIKIFGNSGISYGSCDKMNTKMALELPGGLSLPVSLEVETFRLYEAEECILNREDAYRLLTAYAEQSVQQQMQAGQIIHQTYDLVEDNRLFSLRATLECHEMIARSIEAKWNYEDF